MARSVKYFHTNLVARDWKLLADFYIKVFPRPLFELGDPFHRIRGDSAETVSLTEHRPEHAHDGINGASGELPRLEDLQEVILEKLRAQVGQLEPIESRTEVLADRQLCYPQAGRRKNVAACTTSTIVTSAYSPEPYCPLGEGRHLVGTGATAPVLNCSSA